jgi:hypothetical protein
MHKVDKFSSRSKSSRGNDRENPDLSARAGTAFGGIAGLVAGIAFTGLILSLPTFFNFPTGVFIQALGLSIMGQTSSSPSALSSFDPVALGFAGFLIIIAQCVVIGIILGIVSVRAKLLYISSKKKGVTIGIWTGIIAFLVLYVPIVLTVYESLLSAALSDFSPTELSLNGHSDYDVELPSDNEYLIIMMAWGFFSYIIFGFILGSILRWAYAVRRFDTQQAKITPS